MTPSLRIIAWSLKKKKKNYQKCSYKIEKKGQHVNHKEKNQGTNWQQFEMLFSSAQDNLYCSELDQYHSCVYGKCMQEWAAG